MRFNIVSETGDGLGFAYRLVTEGQDVRFWVRNADAKSVGDGMVPKVGDLEDLVHDASPDKDIFVFDVSGNGVVADHLSDRGFEVIGASLLADRLERDRAFGTSVMEQCAIKVPPTYSFTDFDDAKQFVEQNSTVRWVYKPSKQLGDLSASHVSYDTEDMVKLLENVQSDVDIENPQFELQKFIEDAVAVSTELWFSHGTYIHALTNHTLERKELMNDNIGPSGGCLGNIVWSCDGCPICVEAKRLIRFASAKQYHGMLDLNAIVDQEGSIYGLEFTPRFGYDASPTMYWELINVPLGEFFTEFPKASLRNGYASALRVTIPPWPFEKYHADANVPIRGLPSEDEVYYYNVKRDKGEVVSAGAWGIICLFIGHASSVSGAFRKPMRYAEELRLSNKQYRTDLASQFQKDLVKLSEIFDLELV